METTTHNPPVALPTLSAEVPRVLATGVVVANAVAVVLAAIVIVVTKHADWWPAFTAAVVIAVLCAIGSVLVLSKAAGRSMDWLVTFVMGTSAVRMAVSLIGLIVAVKAFGTPPEATGFMICGFFAVTLVVETSLLNRVLRKATAAAAQTLVGESNA